jgi:hypothetical protein
MKVVYTSRDLCVEVPQQEIKDIRRALARIVGRSTTLGMEIEIENGDEFQTRVDIEADREILELAAKLADIEIDDGWDDEH